MRRRGWVAARVGFGMLLACGGGTASWAQVEAQAPGDVRPAPSSAPTDGTMGGKITKTLPEKDRNAPQFHTVPGDNPGAGSEGRLDMGAGSQMAGGLQIPFGGSARKKPAPPEAEPSPAPDLEP